MTSPDQDSAEKVIAVELPIKTREVEVADHTVGNPTAPPSALNEAVIERAREVGGPLEGEQLIGLGGGDRPRRLVLIGLDGATPELALRAWRAELPNLGRLADRGTWSRIRSSVPWSSIPAWLCMLSGRDPGQLGLYGPRFRARRGYDPPLAIDSRAVQLPRLWDILSSAGKYVGVVGAPATTPAPQVRGHLIGDAFPPQGHPATFPASLGEQVATWLKDTSVAPPAQANDLSQLVQQAYARTEQRFHLARRLLARATYDCFILIDDGIATVQRALWDSLDSSHPRYTAQHPFAGTIGSFYRFVDDQLGELFELLDDDTIIVVASACGAQSLVGELALNEWLIASGELVVKSPLEGPTSLDHCEVDWERTRAWADEAGALYLNVAGRDPQGVIPAHHVDLVRASLAERLRKLPGPDNLPGGVEAHHPATLYKVTRGVAPDLVVTCSRPGWRPSAVLGTGKIWLEAQPGSDAACETASGFFVLHDPHQLGVEQQLGEMTVYDLVPTLLALLNQSIPQGLRGRVVAGLQPT